MARALPGATSRPARFGDSRTALKRVESNNLLFKYEEQASYVSG
jgi:hypothetical protein